MMAACAPAVSSRSLPRNCGAQLGSSRVASRTETGFLPVSVAMRRSSWGRNSGAVRANVTGNGAEENILSILGWKDGF